MLRHEVVKSFLIYAAGRDIDCSNGAGSQHRVSNNLDLEDASDGIHSTQDEATWLNSSVTSIHIAGISIGTKDSDYFIALGWRKEQRASYSCSRQAHDGIPKIVPLGRHPWMVPCLRLVKCREFETSAADIALSFCYRGICRPSH